MIIDTSALVAITFAEPGHQELIAKLTGAPSAGIGTPTIAETGVDIISVGALSFSNHAQNIILRIDAS